VPTLVLDVRRVFTPWQYHFFKVSKAVCPLVNEQDSVKWRVVYVTRRARHFKRDDRRPDLALPVLTGTTESIYQCKASVSPLPKNLIPRTKIAS
jgi:hypothetical protein